MKVSAVVVSHGHAAELARSLPALVPQVDEMLVIANRPGSVRDVSAGVRMFENPRPLTFAANVNLRTPWPSRWQWGRSSPSPTSIRIAE